MKGRDLSIEKGWWRLTRKNIKNIIQLLTLNALKLHIGGSYWILPFSSVCGQKCWRPSANSSLYLLWWCPHIWMLVFLRVWHLLHPCPPLFLSYHIYVSHVHTSVVASESGCFVVGWTVAAFMISSFRRWYIRLTPSVHRNILISVLFISM